MTETPPLPTDPLRGVLARGTAWLLYLDDPNAEVPPPEPLWTDMPDGSSEDTETLLFRLSVAALSSALYQRDAKQNIILSIQRTVNDHLEAEAALARRPGGLR